MKFALVICFAALGASQLGKAPVAAYEGLALSQDVAYLPDEAAIAYKKPPTPHITPQVAHSVKKRSAAAHAVLPYEPYSPYKKRSAAPTFAPNTAAAHAVVAA